MPIDVLCIGHAAYDVSLFVPDYPAQNSKSEVHRMLECGGGPAANAAYLLGRWGVRTGFAGLVGDDPYGKRVIQELKATKVDVSLAETRHGHPTPFSVILVNTQSGSRTVINRKAPAADYRPAPEALARLAPKVILTDGHELAAAQDALAAFPKAASILDAGSAREGTMKLAGRVTYLVASEHFARQATGLSELQTLADRQLCMRRLRQQYRDVVVVVTLGEAGLMLDDGGGFRHLPAYPVTAVDTTAAGDVFHGAFAYGVLRGLPLPGALKLASMAASICVTREGGRASIPSLQDVQEALERTR